MIALRFDEILILEADMYPRQLRLSGADGVSILMRR
jgi:hypothetical protein